MTLHCSANRSGEPYPAIFHIEVRSRGLANPFDLYIPIVTTVCVYDGASFPPIPIAEIEGERKLVLDYNGWERVQLYRKDAPNE
jgi:hypothetical protein